MIKVTLFFVVVESGSGPSEDRLRGFEKDIEMPFPPTPGLELCFGPDPWSALSLDADNVIYYVAENLYYVDCGTLQEPEITRGDLDPATKIKELLEAGFKEVKVETVRKQA